MRLFHRDDCPFCWKARIAFAFAGVSPKFTSVKRGEKHPDLERLSSTSTIPVFVNGELVITQSTVLVEYINDAFAEGKLLPTSVTDRALVRNLNAYSDMTVGPSLRGLVFERRDKPLNKQNLGLIAQSEREWRLCLDYLETIVKPTFMCGYFSIADCALLPRFALADRYEASVDKRHPRLLDYWARAKLSAPFMNSYGNVFSCRG